jgi:acetyl esterase/lipase
VSGTAPQRSSPNFVQNTDLVRAVPMLVPRIAGALAAVLALNLHYPLLGRPFLEGPLTSRPVLALGNAAVGKLVRLGMTKEGVPEPDRTETYSGGRIDVFEPEDGSAAPGGPRVAVIYFHSGAFIAGDRSFGAGMCGFLASHGALCLSVSYRLTNSGTGVAGCIEDAWAALRWTRANANRLAIDPEKIIIAGDSAGGLLATALGTGLGADGPIGTTGASNKVSRAELPAAVIGSWPVTALGSRTYVPTRGADGAWEPTTAGKDFPVDNAFVPSKYGLSAEQTQTRLKTVLASGLLLFGRRWGGLLPAAERYPSDDAESVSPLRYASRPDLPPMLLLTGSADQVVPCDQTCQFAETARAAGNDVAQLVFEGAVHGGGAVNCAAGRHATLDWLRHNDLLTGPVRDSDDPRDSIGGAMRAFKLETVEYEPVGVPFRPDVHKSATLRLRPVKCDHL